MDDTKHVITLAHRFNQDPNGHQVVDLHKRPVPLAHFSADGPQVLRPSGNLEFLDARPENHILHEKFVVKTRPKPSPYPMYISAFDEAIHKGLNKWFGTFKITIEEPQAIIVKIQVFANGMRARWWLVKLNFGEYSATIQILDEGFLY